MINKTMKTTHNKTSSPPYLPAGWRSPTTSLFAQDAAADDKPPPRVGQETREPGRQPHQRAHSEQLGLRYRLRERHALHGQHPACDSVLAEHNWNLITRTIIPVIYAEAPVKGAGDQSAWVTLCRAFGSRPRRRRAAAGFGARARCCFIPADGWLERTQWARDRRRSCLKQQNGWTYGALVNHLWS